jgi:hypothetical protein
MSPAWHFKPEARPSVVNRTPKLIGIRSAHRRSSTALDPGLALPNASKTGGSVVIAMAWTSCEETESTSDCRQKVRRVKSASAVARVKMCLLLYRSVAFAD